MENNKISIGIMGIMFFMAIMCFLLMTIDVSIGRIAVAIEAQNALTARLATVEAKCQEQERALHTLGMIARAELEAAKELNEQMKMGR